MMCSIALLRLYVYPQDFKFRQESFFICMWEDCKKNIHVEVRWSQRPYSAQPPSFRGELPFRYPATLRRHSSPIGILINLTCDPCVSLNIAFFFQLSRAKNKIQVRGLFDHASNVNANDYLVSSRSFIIEQNEITPSPCMRCAPLCIFPLLSGRTTCETIP